MKKVEYSDPIKTFVDSYDKTSHHIWNETTGSIVDARKHIRDHYLGEQKYRCAYCRIEKKESHGLTWDVEHILPKSIFPQFLFEPENLAIACKECNTSKDNHNILTKDKINPSSYPNRSADYTIVHPHFDIYSHHFEVSIVEGKRRYRLLNGDKAKTTYIVCDLSRFDYKFAEWDSFDEALVSRFSKFLERCPKDAKPTEIQRMLCQITFEVNLDF